MYMCFGEAEGSGLGSGDEKKIKWHLVAACCYLADGYKDGRAKLLLLVLDYVITDNSHKLWLERFELNTSVSVAIDNVLW